MRGSGSPATQRFGVRPGYPIFVTVALGVPGTNKDYFVFQYELASPSKPINPNDLTLIERQQLVQHTDDPISGRRYSKNQLMSN
ncbi:MAG: hypothetical protein R3F34_00605 [Planctomycetota bacterium]